MQGNIGGEENARLGGKKFKAGRKNLREKKRKKEKEGEKVKEKSFKQQWKYNFFLKNGNFAVKNKGRGQNDEVNNE